MLQRSAIIIAGAVTLALALPSTHVVHEERHSTSPRWVRRDRVAWDAKLPMRIGLVQSNLDKGHDFLMDVADPSSPNYGKHWTAEQVLEAFQPSNDTRDAVLQWLIEGGIPATSIVQSDNRAWLAFHASSHRVEALLHTTYHEYEDVRTGGLLPACERYHVPAEIQKHIDYVQPGIRLLAPRVDPPGKKTEKRAIGSISTRRFSSRLEADFIKEPSPTSLHTCDKAITPACIAALYQIPEASSATPNNSFGLFESELQFWNQEELNIFLSKFSPRVPNGTHPTDYDIDGGVAKTRNISLAGGESIDLELAYPIVYPQDITIFNVDDLHYQTWPNDTYTWGFNTLLDAIDGSYCTYAAYGEKGDLPGVDPTYPDPGPEGYNGSLQCGIFKPTNVISLSYSGWEADVPISYQLRQCHEFLKLGLQGVTFTFSSGDTGVGDYPGDLGFNGPTGCLGPKHDIYNPGWPLGCPYITGVGGTQVDKGKTVHDPESAFFVPPPKGSKIYKGINNTSGGGFSNVFSIPSFQKKAVASYFANHDPGSKYYSKLAVDDPSTPYLLPNVTALAGNTGGVYNRAGRGHPDVSAVAANIAAILEDFYLKVDGTSASAPIFGSIINRINDERLAKGKKPVGFINPVLYSHPEILNDVTSGNNSGCYQPGFKAVPGWDPVTGLGTPNYPKMLELWLSLP